MRKWVVLGVPLLLGCHALLPLEPPGAGDLGAAPDAPGRPPTEAGTPDLRVDSPRPSDLLPSDLLPAGVIVRKYGKKTLQPGSQSDHFADLWDLTACAAARAGLGCDLVLRYTVDLSGVPAIKGTYLWTEVGIREEGEADFNPDNKGGWMVSFAVNPDSDPNTQDQNDRHTAQSTGGLGEKEYDVHDCAHPKITTPVSDLNPTGTFGFWFDRDGTDAVHAGHPLAKDGATHNTKGVYRIRLCYRAATASTGTLCHTVNDVAPGFYVKNSAGQAPDVYPAGIGFGGEMDDMQVFVGFQAMAGAAGTVVLDDFEVIGCPRK